MATDVRGEKLRARAAAARHWSADERARAHDLACTATEICGESESLRRVHRRGTSRRLVWETEAADDGVVGWTLIREYVEFDSALVGRDVVIEEAKTVLCELYGISRGDAFSLLRRASSQRNQKLREVARRVVVDAVAPR